jgi:hypothetical protein
MLLCNIEAAEKKNRGGSGRKGKKEKVGITVRIEVNIF